MHDRAHFWFDTGISINATKKPLLKQEEITLPESHSFPKPEYCADLKY
jgi:hypothetical protein